MEAGAGEVPDHGVAAQVWAADLDQAVDSDQVADSEDLVVDQVGDTNSRSIKLRLPASSGT